MGKAGKIPHERKSVATNGQDGWPDGNERRLSELMKKQRCDTNTGEVLVCGCNFFDRTPCAGTPLVLDMDISILFILPAYPRGLSVIG